MNNVVVTVFYLLWALHRRITVHRILSKNQRITASLATGFKELTPPYRECRLPNSVTSSQRRAISPSARPRSRWCAPMPRGHRETSTSPGWCPSRVSAAWTARASGPERAALPSPTSVQAARSTTERWWQPSQRYSTSESRVSGSPLNHFVLVTSRD